MLSKRIRFWSSLLFALDCLVLAGCWLGAWALRSSGWPAGANGEGPPLSEYLGVLLLVPAFWALSFHWLKLDRFERRPNPAAEGWEIVKATGLLTVCLVSAGWLLFHLALSRVFVAAFFLCACFALAAARSAFRWALGRARTGGRHSRAVLVVGTGRLARAVQGRLAAHPELGLRLVGHVSELPGEVGDVVGESAVVGHLDELDTLVARHRVGEVFVAQGEVPARKVEALVATLSERLIDVDLVSDLYERALLGCPVEDFDGLPLLSVSASPLAGWGGVAKRGVDVLLAAVGLVVGAPLMAAIALGVRLGSPGPVFYRQERMGLDGRSFTIFKFRTMRADAENGSAVWSSRNDPRCTRLGTLLRRLSLDELPQLWNVLRGQMSLVGPRPERPVFVEQFRRSLPLYMLRHRVKAGLTGWAQVHSLRGDSSVEDRLEYDLFYIKNWSLGLDLKILWLTLRGGFLNRNA